MLNVDLYYYQLKDALEQQTPRDPRNNSWMLCELREHALNEKGTACEKIECEDCAEIFCDWLIREAK